MQPIRLRYDVRQNISETFWSKWIYDVMVHVTHTKMKNASVFEWNCVWRWELFDASTDWWDVYVQFGNISSVGFVSGVHLEITATIIVET